MKKTILEKILDELVAIRKSEPKTMFDTDFVVKLLEEALLQRKRDRDDAFMVSRHKQHIFVSKKSQHESKFKIKGQDLQEEAGRDVDKRTRAKALEIITDQMWRVRRARYCSNELRQKEEKELSDMLRMDIDLIVRLHASKDMDTWTT